jgi:hypothetical protein
LNYIYFNRSSDAVDKTLNKEKVDSMVVVLNVDEEVCNSFKDVAHLKAHIAFFKEYHSLETVFNIDGEKGPYHNIKEGTDGLKVCQLTEKGMELLDKTVCRGTTAFGKMRVPTKVCSPTKETKVDKNFVEGAVPGPDTLDTPVIKLPECPLFEATLAGGCGEKTCLHQETHFVAVREGEEPSVLTSKVPVALQVVASPAILSLFLRTSLCEIKSLPEDLAAPLTHKIQRHLCQPMVNIRAVTDIGRLYDEKMVKEERRMNKAQANQFSGERVVMSDKAGLIQTAMGNGNPGNNFVEHDFYLVPYSVSDSASAPEGSAEVTTVEVTMDLLTLLEGHPKAKTIAVEEVESLWDALFTGQAKFRPDFGTDTEGSDVKATKAFAQLIGTMQQVFGGLKTAEDWVQLYMRLCNCDQLRPYDFGRLAVTLPWPELNYMIHHLMGAVSPLGIALLDGLGRVSATKLASISLYPATSYRQLIEPNKAYALCSEKGGVGEALPDFRVVGEPGIVKCIALNQGGTLGQASLNMCQEFSKGVLKRATQPTSMGLRDLLSDFLQKAVTENREKFVFGTTVDDLTRSSDLLREAAYEIIFEEGTSNNHLKLVQASETDAKNKTLKSVKEECIEFKWGRKTAAGPTECSLGRHTLVTWLVNLMTHSFFFASKVPTTIGDRSYREMLILLRNNGNQRLHSGNRDGMNLYKASMVANFKVRLFISWGLSVSSITSFRI